MNLHPIANDDMDNANGVGDDEVEDEWRQAVDLRYGRASSSSKPSNLKTKKTQNKLKTQEQNDSLQTPAAATEHEADVTPVVSAFCNMPGSGSTLPGDEMASPGAEMPVRSWIDPANSRVIAEFASGKLKALGVLFRDYVYFHF